MSIPEFSNSIFCLHQNRRESLAVVSSLSFQVPKQSLSQLNPWGKTEDRTILLVPDPVFINSHWRLQPVSLWVVRAHTGTNARKTTWLLGSYLGSFA